MDYSSAYKLFESMGFTFKYGECDPETLFNDVKVLWRGTEFGTMQIDSMVLRRGDGYVHQFNYYGLYPDSQVREVAEKFIERFESAHDAAKREMVDVIREYFERRRKDR